jgi:hypothetical protein
MKVARVDTWAASIKDKPGGAGEKLAKLAAAGVNLELVVARRAPDKPGTGVVFVTPIKGGAQERAARKAGFKTTKSLNTVRVEGKDKKGRGATITKALAKKGVNLRGLTAAAIGKKFVAHLALDKPSDAAKAMKILKAL